MTVLSGVKNLARYFSEHFFGGSTMARENPVTSTVGTTSTQLLLNNPERIGWIVCNRDANPIYVSFGGNATTAGSIPIAGSGGMLTASIIDDGELTTMPVNAISAAGGAVVDVWEIFRT